MYIFPSLCLHVRLDHCLLSIFHSAFVISADVNTVVSHDSREEVGGYNGAYSSVRPLSLRLRIYTVTEGGRQEFRHQLAHCDGGDKGSGGGVGVSGDGDGDNVVRPNYGDSTGVKRTGDDATGVDNVERGMNVAPAHYSSSSSSFGGSSSCVSSAVVVITFLNPMLTDSSPTPLYHPTTSALTV
ncbi:unnamed protein product [Hydatigera taeniaeformis]|uniref:Uncharacterized protein n=1 Tax=Hydatigena taeniaeformis TaxID=6205 RepID=A0A3P7EN47_HYDTA|nr:unnamed protein product [Hydatigera taeniaeformis]